MATYRVIKDKSNPYIMVNKHGILDKSLSFKAKGILMYFLSRPDDWEFYEKEIATNSTDGKDSVRSGIQELISKGYIKRAQKRTCDGKFTGYEYQVFETPQNNNESKKEENRNPFSENPTSDKPFSEKSPLLNKDSTKYRIYNIYTFWNEKGIVKHKKLTSKMQRAINSLLKDYSVEDIKSAITNYSKILNSKEYYFNYKWTLEEFLKRGLEKFMVWEVCSNNFKSNTTVQNTQSKSVANSAAYKII